MNEELKKFVKRIVLGAVAFLTIIVFSSFRIVSSGQVGVRYTLGKISDTPLYEGIHFKRPFIDRITKVDTQTQKNQVEVAAASKDLQNVRTNVALNYRVQGEKVPSLLREVKDWQERLIDPAIQEAVKAATANYTAEELITKRTAVKDSIVTVLRDRLSPKYIIVEDVSIVNFEFSETFEQAIEAKVTAEQNALASKNKLEQVKYEAEQQVTRARAEAESIRIQAQAVTQQGGKDYVQLEWVKAWQSGGAKVPQIITSANAGGFIFNIGQEK